MAYQKRTKRDFNKKTRDAKDQKMADSKDQGSKGSKYNDPSWYVKEGQIAKDVASLSFNNALGARTMVKEDHNGSWTTVSVPYGVPGILSLCYVPSVGVSNDGYSPINIAAKNLYSNIRSKNSGGKNYDSPDLMLYLVAMDSIYMIIQHLQRAYGAARVYSQLNRYIGDVMLSAMGFNPSDVRGNLAQFRAQINMLIVKASVFAVPATMSYYLRHAWMARATFQDGDRAKSQTYFYRPLGAYKYVETDGPGYCQFVPCATKVVTNPTAGDYIDTDVWTVAQWFVYANNLISALVSSEDINIMSGDILKAYGDGNQFKLGLIPEEYELESGYSEEVLDQIHNTMFAGAFPRHFLDPTSETEAKTLDWTGFNIYQDATIGDGALLCKPQFMRARQLGLSRILDMYDKEPTPERVLVGTRNMLAGDVYNSVSNFTITTLTSCGSDITMFGKMWDFRVDPNDSSNWIPRERTIGVSDGIEATEVGNDPGDYTAFHRAPLLYLFNDTANGAFGNTLGEIDNYTLVSADTLKKMHESALLSMFGVPV